LKKDTFVTASLVGFGSTALEIIFSLVLKHTGLIKTPLYEFVGKLSVGEIPAKPWMIALIGLPGHIFNGIIFAFAFILILQKWGRDYLYLKGLGYGAFLWRLSMRLLYRILLLRI